MKTFALIVALLSTVLVTHAAGDMPIKNGKLQSPLNGGGFTITNVTDILDGNGNSIVSGPGGGEANTGANIGSGVGIFWSKSGVSLQFKNLATSGGATVASNATTVTISADAAGAGAAALSQATNSPRIFTPTLFNAVSSNNLRFAASGSTNGIAGWITNWFGGDPTETFGTFDFYAWEGSSSSYVLGLRIDDDSVQVPHDIVSLGATRDILGFGRIQANGGYIGNIDSGAEPWDLNSDGSARFANGAATISDTGVFAGGGSGLTSLQWKNLADGALTNNNPFHLYNSSNPNRNSYFDYRGFSVFATNNSGDALAYLFPDYVQAYVNNGGSAASRSPQLVIQGDNGKLIVRPSFGTVGGYTTTIDTNGIVTDGPATAATFSGSGSGLTALNASQLASGTVAPARLGSGSSITTKFLRGDSTWQTISGGGDLLAANNLSDVSSASTARANIGAETVGAASTLSNNIQQDTISSIGVITKGDGIFIGNGIGNWKQRAFDMEESELGLGAIAQGGSVGGMDSATSTNSFVQAQGAAVAMGYMGSLSNAQIIAEGGSFAGAHLGTGRGATVTAEEGSFAGLEWLNTTNSSVIAAMGSFAGANYLNSWNVHLTVNDGLGRLNANTKSNINLTLNRSVVIASPPNNYTATINNTIGIIDANGNLTGFNTNGFFGSNANFSGQAAVSALVSTNGFTNQSGTLFNGGNSTNAGTVWTHGKGTNDSDLYVVGNVYSGGTPALTGTSNLDATKLTGTVPMANLSSFVTTNRGTLAGTVLKGDGARGVTNATPGVDFIAPVPILTNSIYDTNIVTSTNNWNWPGPTNNLDWARGTLQRYQPASTTPLAITNFLNFPVGQVAPVVFWIDNTNLTALNVKLPSPCEATNSLGGLTVSVNASNRLQILFQWSPLSTNALFSDQQLIK